ncbi:protein kinase domain, Eukaryotic elongation factor 2 kinase [Artemisia annua]|uniref:Protein kinase domain, Eukaryotic elongation factor 2 kinase n=1 Tax=Artemisia annua TaxID=35608 RepID=A0A2U1LDE8_ARTAN|nr:protein kinase domain, Eukaryotic elongation factor 2 kinase [Artemisia annua]
MDLIERLHELKSLRKLKKGMESLKFIGTLEQKDTTNCKKDVVEAFQPKDLQYRYTMLRTLRLVKNGAISSLTIYARHCFCWYMNNEAQEALKDVTEAHNLSPDWYIAIILQAVAI